MTSIKDHMTKEMVALTDAMTAKGLHPVVEVEIKGQPDYERHRVRVLIRGSKDIPGDVISECDACGHVKKTYGTRQHVVVTADRLANGRLQVSAGVNHRRAKSFKHATLLVNQLP